MACRVNRLVIGWGVSWGVSCKIKKGGLAIGKLLAKTAAQNSRGNRLGSQLGSGCEIKIKKGGATIVKSKGGELGLKCGQTVAL